MSYDVDEINQALLNGLLDDGLPVLAFRGSYMGIDRTFELPEPKPKKTPQQRAMSDQARHYLRKLKKRTR